LERLPDPTPSQVPERPSGTATARGLGVPIVLGAATDQG
jgi:hypothetical protein